MNADNNWFHHKGNVSLLEPLEQKLFTTKDTKTLDADRRGCTRID